jgi:hypothetical protein
MAKEKTEHEGGERGSRKPKKKHLHQIIHTKVKDGSFVHEHVYKDHPDDHHSQPPMLAGTSPDIADVHQHIDDHFGPGADGADGGQEQEEGGAGGEQEEAEAQG